MDDHISNLNAEDRQKVFERSHTIINLSKSIRRTPSKASLWFQKAEELHQMGYTDLAVGDVWKAAMLNDLQVETTHRVRAQLGIEGTRARFETVMESQKEIYISLACFPLVLEDYAELIEICNEGIAKYGFILQEVFSTFRTKAEEQLGSQNHGLNVNLNAEILYQSYDGAGEFEKSLQSAYSRCLPYPFMPPKYLRRQPNGIVQSKLLFHTSTTSCHLLSSSVRKGNESQDVFGVFATRNIKAGETLLEDRTVLGSCSPIVATRTTAAFTAGTSLHLAITRSYAVKMSHGSSTTAKSYQTPSRATVPSGYASSPCACRAACIPWTTPFIACLTPNYVPVGRKWSFTNMTKHPFEILSQLGINACKDERYDVWVLHAIWARVLNNKCLQHTRNADSKTYDLNIIGRMYSFFNHSCEPNAKSQGVERNPTLHDLGGCCGGTTKILKATRKIKRGEETFISYAKFTGKETKEE
ncbi:MAG: hypothetical protein Q9228_006669, partial [Teloschistes exilis]